SQSALTVLVDSYFLRPATALGNLSSKHSQTVCGGAAPGPAHGPSRPSFEAPLSIIGRDDGGRDEPASETIGRGHAEQKQTHAAEDRDRRRHLSSYERPNRRSLEGSRGARGSEVTAERGF